MIRLCHLITGLGIGGAERALLRLCEGLAAMGYHQKVLVMIAPGPVATDLERAGIPVTSLYMRRGTPELSGLLRLIAEIRDFRPDVLQTWMYHADIAGVLARPFVPNLRLAWNLRNSEMQSASTRWLVRYLALLSRFPDVIVANSESGLADHIRLGYRPRRSVCIPNGVDIRRFRPQPEQRAASRAALNIPAHAPVIGLIARCDPQKDHTTFLDAAQLFCHRHPQVRFVLVGLGCEPGSQPLDMMIRQRGLTDNVIRLGLRTDLPDIYPAFDLVCLSSAFGEGTPNVLLEALACGIPCVATDVGDCRRVIGGSGAIVPPRNPVALNAAWSEVLGLDLAPTARRWAVEQFAETRVSQAYDALYRSLCSPVAEPMVCSMAI